MKYLVRVVTTTKKTGLKSKRSYESDNGDVSYHAKLWERKLMSGSKKLTVTVSVKELK